MTARLHDTHGADLICIFFASYIRTCSWSLAADNAVLTASHLAVQALGPEEGQAFLDIGSGTGYLTMVAANLVGHTGRAVGLEVHHLVLLPHMYPATTSFLCSAHHHCKCARQQSLPLKAVQNKCSVCLRITTSFELGLPLLGMQHKRTGQPCCTCLQCMDWRC